MDKYSGPVAVHYSYHITGPVSRDGSFGPSPVSGGAPSPPLMMEPPVRPLSANPREGPRSEFSKTSVFFFLRYLGKQTVL